jgi:HAD superfamily hydrolase (TIGR01509 family)
VHLLSVPRHLPVERGEVIGRRLAVAAITLDFGNTLVRVDRSGLRAVVEDTADELLARGIIRDRPHFLTAWAEERDRQFREEVPHYRETDIDRRAVRVLARVGGMAPPVPEIAWDDEVALAMVAPGEVQAAVDAYSDAFLRRMTPVADATATLQQLAARGFDLAILSNWPLAVTIDRFAEAQGWLPYLRAIVVSQRVGTIKPHPTIFRAAESALGIGDGGAILHVGDDWAADVVGASRAGWHTAYLRGRQEDTPLPTSSRDDGAGGSGSPAVVPDLEIDELAELDALVDLRAT